MFVELLHKVMRHQDLSADEAFAAMEGIVDGSAHQAQVAGLLVGLAMKGERPAEIVGFARSMRSRAVPLAVPPGGCVDLCGTGGDGSGTFNISSAASVVVAAAGERVAKHGNRSVSSRCGSADVFEQLGVRIDAPAGVVERCLREAGLAFLFAPTFHPSMRNAGAVRRELAVRSAFNLLGPLTNPARPSRQLVGVSRPEQTELIARALGLLGSGRAWVVHGADGLDEVSTTGYTKVSECRDGRVNTFYLHPADLGLRKAALNDLVGGDAVVNAAVLTGVLEGRPGAARDIVLANAGAVLLLAGRATTIREGLAVAAHAIDSGAARETLRRLIACSQEEA
ncbi:MAG: anthranilate phosphoribosyltransferase [Acidobacteriota bacterium]